jgi:SOS response regulatory protein OraA/RecX
MRAKLSPLLETAMKTKSTRELREQLEALALSQNKCFWKVIDEAIARGEKEGYVDLTDL